MNQSIEHWRKESITLSQFIFQDFFKDPRNRQPEPKRNYFDINFRCNRNCGKEGWLITDFWPEPQVQATQFQVHISYFLQKCKKGKPGEMSLPFLKNRSEVFYRILGLSISITFFSYPAHSIEVVLNMRPHRFHNYRFFRLLILNHTIHKKIHLLDSFRDKSPWITSFSSYIECFLI